MMDVFIPTVAFVILVIIGVAWGVTAKGRAKTTIGWVMGIISFIALFFLISDWKEGSDYDAKQFELTHKLPLEWNKAHQAYFFHHDAQWKSAETYIDHFDPNMVQTNSDYDSCMVYQVSLPTIWGYFDTRWWSEDFEYRQSEDILLLSREKKAIEVK